MMVKLFIALTYITATVVAVPSPTRCTMWPDSRVSVGYTWRERCRNCTCVEGQGNVCDGPTCAIPYNPSQEMVCGRWSTDGCCCEELGCMKHGRMYSIGEYYPRTPENPCDVCMCSEMGNRMCQMTMCQPECVDGVQIPGQCCPTCLNGPNCAMPQVYTNGNKPVRLDYQVLKLNDFALITDSLEGAQTWNCTCTVAGGEALCSPLNKSLESLLTQFLSRFMSSAV